MNHNLDDDFFDAIKVNNLVEVKRILEEGVDVNISDYDGCTAVERAIKHGYDNLVIALIKEGAYLSELALDQIELSASNFLADFVQGRVNLFNAIFDNDLTALIKFEKIYGLKLVLDSWDETPLIYAVKQERPALVKWMLHKGANIYFRNMFGDTAFHLAVKFGNLEMVRYFDECKTDWDTAGQEGFTALNYAVSRSYVDIAKFLIQKNASLDIQDEVFHMTPRQIILAKNNIQLIKEIEQRELKHSL